MTICALDGGSTKFGVMPGGGDIAPTTSSRRDGIGECIKKGVFLPVLLRKAANDNEHWNGMAEGRDSFMLYQETHELYSGIRCIKLCQC